MPYTRKQVRTAQAIAHGWKPTGSARSFKRKVKGGGTLASMILDETGDGKRNIRRKKKKSA